jgi:hypothetical protein
VLAKQVLYYLSHATSPLFFASVFFFFSYRVLHFLPRAGLRLQSSYLRLWNNWDYRHKPPTMSHPACLLRWVLGNFLPGVWPLTVIFLMCTSQVAGITRVYHHSWLFEFFVAITNGIVFFLFHIVHYCV